MKKLLPLSIIILFILGCQSSNTNTQEVTLLKEQLQAAQVKIQQMENTSSGRLVHVVYADLKPDADRAAFIKEVQKLKAIKVVYNLEIGTFKELGDSRALSDYEVVFQMDFNNENAYQIYQKHPIHLALKEAAKDFLAAPPKTYDFIIQ